MRKRFLRERRIGLNLEHPQVVRVYDVDEDGNQLYIAMEPGSAISWDGTDQNNRRLGSGVYFVTLQAGDYTITEKMLLIR